MTKRPNPTPAGWFPRRRQRVYERHSAQVAGLSSLLRRRALRGGMRAFMYSGGSQSTSGAMSKRTAMTADKDNQDPPIVQPPKRIAIETPDYFTINLKYCDVLADAHSGGTAVYHKFRANSVFDPDSTVTGHQPNGFDKWAAIFKYYRVIRCRFKLTIPNPDGSQPLLTSLRVSHETNTPTNVRTVGEMKHGELQLVGINTGGDGFVEYTRDIYPGDYQGNIRTIAATAGSSANGFWTLVNANAADPLLITYGAQFPTSVSATVVSLVEMEYTVQFREPGSLVTDADDNTNTAMAQED